MAVTVKPDWKTKLVAWWEGYDLDGLRTPWSASAGKSPKSRERREGSAPEEFWSATRIDVAEIVWGRGFHTPGGEDHIPVLIKPFGLDETMSVLDLGAGLGGATRLMARVSDGWVTGYEEDPQLAAAGMQRSIKAGLEKRAPVMHADFESLIIDKRVDAIFSKEAFYRVQHKTELFEALRAGLKPRGQLLFTDYVLKHSASTGEAIARWQEGEERPAYPWTVNQVVERLRHCRFDIRITEDITEQYRAQVLSAWERASGIIADKPHADPETQKIILDEAELWMRRVAALDTGDLRVFRFFALGAA